MRKKALWTSRFVVVFVNEVEWKWKFPRITSVAPRREWPTDFTFRRWKLPGWSNRGSVVIYLQNLLGSKRTEKKERVAPTIPWRTLFSSGYSKRVKFHPNKHRVCGNKQQATDVTGDIFKCRLRPVAMLEQRSEINWIFSMFLNPKTGHVKASIIGLKSSVAWFEQGINTSNIYPEPPGLGFGTPAAKTWITFYVINFFTCKFVLSERAGDVLSPLVTSCQLNPQISAKCNPIMMLMLRLIDICIDHSQLQDSIQHFGMPIMNPVTIIDLCIVSVTQINSIKLGDIELMKKSSSSVIFILDIVLNLFKFSPVLVHMFHSL